MASPSTVVTMGFGSFGSVNLLPTLGYGIGVSITTETATVFTSLLGIEGYRAPLKGIANYRADLFGIENYRAEIKEAP